MDELTQLIKKNIKLKYSSTRRFAEELGIPQTTIVSAIKNGVGGTAFTTVCKMCKALDIKLFDGIYPVVITDSTRNILEKLAKLDDKGIHTVSTVLEMEYIRCNADVIFNKIDESELMMKEYMLSKELSPTKKEVAEMIRSLD